MQETRKNLSPLITEESIKLSLEELSKEYKKEQNPIYLATAFDKLFLSIIQISQKYFGLTEEDIASFALEKLDYCLISFDDSRSKFITYFYNVLNNKFREETQYLNTQKRKLNYEAMSYDLAVENGYDAEAYDSEIEVLNFDFLDDTEKMYCELIIQEYTNYEISKILNVSLTTVYNIRKKLRKTFNNQQYFLYNN